MFLTEHFTIPRLFKINNLRNDYSGAVDAVFLHRQ
jgi:hypothetical protein